MKFYSTSNRDHSLSFSQAVLQGLAPDRGLYFPSAIPELSAAQWSDILQCNIAEMGALLMAPYTDGELTSCELLQIFDEVFNFEIPLVDINSDISTLELFHGPTGAFKDVGARFLSRVMSRFSDEKLTILVATSGDTGSAVANGFLGLENIDVVILYPKGKTSKLQEQQLTTLGQNIRALEVEGTFDDCQDMVKSAFLDKEIQAQRPLSSANSINLARWIPQGIYFAWALAQSENENPVIAVPSGNFGNLASGMLMQKMGMPVGRFIAATNLNDSVPRFLKGSEYKAKSSMSTISNAMDVGDPSNFIRMVHLSGGEEELRQNLTGYSCGDTTTREWIRHCYKNFNYVCDPHGAIGYGALRSNLNIREHGIFMETAHPAKFGDVVEPTLAIELEVPERLKECLNKQKEALLIPASSAALKEYFLSR